MSKPEIIGYQADPDDWSSPRLPDMTIGSEGVWVRHGSAPVRIEPDELDGYMRYHGYKRVYNPRNFRAKRRSGGYSVYCGVCNTSAYTDRHLPHDFAELHARDHHSWVGSEYRSQFATEVTETPFGSTLGLNREHSEPIVTQLEPDDDECDHQETYMHACVACGHVFNE